MKTNVLSTLRSAERRNRPRWRARHLPRTALAEWYVNGLIGDELDRQLTGVDPLNGGNVWLALLEVHAAKICKLNLVRRSPRQRGRAREYLGGLD